MADFRDKKLVIAVSSRALFDLNEANSVFEKEGVEAYRKYQSEHATIPLKPGPAFPFIRRLLSLNSLFPAEQEPIQVVVLSRNNIETGERFFFSCRHHCLSIKRGSFTAGFSPYAYIPSYGASLFLSANPKDVEEARKAGYPAGLVNNNPVRDDPEDRCLRVAFDFDCVLVDNESEEVYSKEGYTAFNSHEILNSSTPHNPGPLKPLFEQLGALQALDIERCKKEGPGAAPAIRIAIITSRGAKASSRMITDINAWGVPYPEVHLLGGADKNAMLRQFSPHIFFDDKVENMNAQAPSVLIPFMQEAGNGRGG